jgi:short-chain fatty acids transporter
MDANNLQAIDTAKRSRRSLLSRATDFFVFLFEKIMPDPFIFAILLTFIGTALAFVFVPGTRMASVAEDWYAGVFAIFTFAFQMVIVLIAGYALATSPLVHRGLEKIASSVSTPRGAVSLTVTISMIACWLNWGLGLVTAALLAREIAKRIRIDFGWLVGAAYSGFVISTEGISGSIALSQATHGSALNLVEKVTGKGLALNETVFTAFNLVPVIAVAILMPVLFRFQQPAEENTVVADPARLREEDRLHPPKENAGTLSGWLDNAWILNLLLALFVGFAVVTMWLRHGFSIELNSVILILIFLGLLLHWRPSAYVGAVKNAARVSGSLVLQYPLYGGLMGIITSTGLAAVLSKAFIGISTARTLPFFTYLTSMIITFFIPSGGGHWAVQGPFAVPAAASVHASLAATTMAVAQGESVANMLQPFWALPILAIAGIKMRHMMGFMVITFLVSFLVFGTSLLFLVPTR